MVLQTFHLCLRHGKALTVRSARTYGSLFSKTHSRNSKHSFSSITKVPEFVALAQDDKDENDNINLESNEGDRFLKLREGVQDDNRLETKHRLDVLEKDLALEIDKLTNKNDQEKDGIQFGTDNSNSAAEPQLKVQFPDSPNGENLEDTYEVEEKMNLLLTSMNSELINVLDYSRLRQTQIEYEKLEHLRTLAAIRVQNRALFDTASGEYNPVYKDKDSSSDYDFGDDPIFAFVKESIEKRAAENRIVSKATGFRKFHKLPIDAVASGAAFEWGSFVKRIVLDVDGKEPLEFRTIADKIRSTIEGNMKYSDQQLWKSVIVKNQEENVDVDVSTIILQDLIENTWVTFFEDNGDPDDLHEDDIPLGAVRAFGYDYGFADADSDFDPDTVKLEVMCPQAVPGVFMDIELLKEFDPSVSNDSLPAMCCPPKPWTDAYNGGFILERHRVIRYHEEQYQQMHAVSRADMEPVFLGLNVLGSLPWKINKLVYDLVQKIREDNLGVAGIVKQNIKLEHIPKRPEYDPNDEEKKQEYRRWKMVKDRIEREYQTLRSKRDDTTLKMACATEALKHDIIYFPHSLDFRGRTYPLPPHLNHLGNDLSRGLLSFGKGKPLGKRGIYWMKVHLANQFGFDKASFDDRVAWIDERLDLVLDNAESPIDEKNPTDPKWWATADCPWQAIATIFDLAAAIKSGNPEEYVSHLTVHQDGSCNGLQHYAALGRDRSGGEKVNLVDSDKPQDVYSSVARLVQKAVDEDAALYNESKKTEIASILQQISNGSTISKEMTKTVQPYIAHILQDKITRKVVKQTTMTSVYGVTFIGARDQIMNRLEETNEKSRELRDRGEEHPVIIDEELLIYCSNYLAKITQRAIGDTFKSAEGIMEWLKQCASIITSLDEPVCWLTPLGFPIVQPYRRKAGKGQIAEHGLVRKFDLRNSMPVAKQKQKSAFPPNFVHALDSSHMLLTAIACADESIEFTAVHDSYWAHACDIDRMNELLRDKFVELHSQDILYDLLEQFKTRYPIKAKEFPDPPIINDLDINLVKNSTYFFN